METFNNGLQTFSLQNNDEAEVGATFNALRPTVAALLAQPVSLLAPPALAASDPPVTSDPPVEPDLTALDPESAARHYLKNAFDSSDLPTFTAPSVNGDKAEFKTLGTETLPLTGTKTVKFRQYNNKVPVYGSLVTVELDTDNNLVTLNSALGNPSNVDAIATIAPAAVLAKVRSLAGYEDEPHAELPPDSVPRLSYYYDTGTQRWRLVYIVEDIRKVGDKANAEQNSPSTSTEESEMHGRPLLSDYVVDAHTNQLVAELPRMLNAGGSPQVVTINDGLGNPRQVRVEALGTGFRLHDAGLNVSTYDFRFQDIDFNRVSLPGALIESPPLWESDTISAHANACEVAAFYQEVLHRNGLDNMGYPLKSSVNCVQMRGGGQGQTWKNAAWIGTQMVYGQQPDSNGNLRSFALDLDVVGHEITHGLTQFTARLEYISQSGALNESYSDIMGVIIANRNVANISNWTWEIGRDLSGNGQPIRDISHPEQFSQPAHMSNYQNFTPPYDMNNDNGGVHINSGIHNKAAYNLITSKDNAGAFLFTMQEAAALFYIALTQYLSRTSGFSASRHAVELAGGSLFRTDPQKADKLAAISAAFAQTGIQ